MFKTDAKSVTARTFFRGIHLSIDFPGAPKRDDMVDGNWSSTTTTLWSCKLWCSGHSIQNKHTRCYQPHDLDKIYLLHVLSVNFEPLYDTYVAEHENLLIANSIRQQLIIAFVNGNSISSLRLKYSHNYAC